MRQLFFMHPLYSQILSKSQKECLFQYTHTDKKKNFSGPKKNPANFTKRRSIPLRNGRGSSLVIQWPSLSVPKAGAWGWSLVRELDPASHDM